MRNAAGDIVAEFVRTAAHVGYVRIAEGRRPGFTYEVSGPFGQGSTIRLRQDGKEVGETWYDWRDGGTTAADAATGATLHTTLPDEQSLPAVLLEALDYMWGRRDGVFR